jgi:hypothetical protein
MLEVIEKCKHTGQVIAAETLQTFLRQDQAATEEGSFAVLNQVLSSRATRLAVHHRALLYISLSRRVAAHASTCQGEPQPSRATPPYPHPHKPASPLHHAL